MKTKAATAPSAVEIEHLKPPPEPWGQFATVGSLYLLGDVEQIGAERLAEYLNEHPLIAVKTGRKEHIVIGQYRSWELLRTFSHLKPNLFKSVPVYVKKAASEEIDAMAAENLFLEGLISTLSPEYALSQLANIWHEMTESSRRKVLPMVRTQADFANALAYASRTGFDPRRLNRLNRPSDENSQASQTESPRERKIAANITDESA